MEDMVLTDDGSLMMTVRVGEIDPVILAVLEHHHKLMEDDAYDYCTCDDCQEDLKAIKKDIKAFKRVLVYFGRFVA